VAKDVKEARRLYDIVKQQGRDGARGIVQGEKALSRIELHEAGGSHTVEPGGAPQAGSD
jgi:hypothetical protein